MAPANPRTWGRWLHDMFEASLLVKAALATAETLSGLSLWALPNERLAAFSAWLGRNDLTHESHEWPVQVFERALAGFSTETQHFYAWYLMSHGVLKLLMVWLLVRKVPWAYPASMLMLAGFVAYQTQQWLATGSMPLLFLTAFDMVMIALIWREYRGLRAARAG